MRTKISLVFILAFSYFNTHAKSRTIAFDNQTGLSSEQLAFIFCGCRQNGNVFVPYSQRPCESRYVPFRQRIYFDYVLRFSDLLGSSYGTSLLVEQSSTGIRAMVLQIYRSIVELFRNDEVNSFSILLATLPTNSDLYQEIDHSQVRDIPIIADTKYTIELHEPDEKQSKHYFTVTLSPLPGQSESDASLSCKHLH